MLKCQKYDAAVHWMQLQRRAEQMKKNLEQQEKELEEKLKAFEAEREAWEEQNKFEDQYVVWQLYIFCSVLLLCV